MGKLLIELCRSRCVSVTAGMLFFSGTFTTAAVCDGNTSNKRRYKRIREGKRDEKDPIVIVGGGIMGLSTAHLLATTTSSRKVIVIDANHALRGSWGESRASHLTIEEPVLLHMGLHSMPAYQDLQRRHAAATSARRTRRCATLCQTA